MKLTFQHGYAVLGGEESEQELDVFARRPVAWRAGQLTFDTHNDDDIQPTIVDGHIYCLELWWSDVVIKPHGKGTLLDEEAFQTNEVQITNAYIRNSMGIDRTLDDWFQDLGLGTWTYENGILTVEVP